MSITMTFNANDAYELKTIMETIATAFAPQKAVTENAIEGEKILQTVAAPEQPAAKKNTVKKVQETVKETATSSTPVVSITEVTLEQIRAAVNERKETHREGIKAALAEYGVEKIPALKPEQYRDFLTKIQSL